MFPVALRPTSAFVSWIVFEDTFPLFTIPSKLLTVEIPVRYEPSPIKRAASTLPVATRPTSVFVSWIVFEDTFPISTISLKPCCSNTLILDTFEIISVSRAIPVSAVPSPLYSSAVTLPYTCTLIAFDVSGINSESSGELSVCEMINSLLAPL